MQLFDPEHVASPVARLDPRSRIVAAFALALFIVLLDRWAALGAMAAMALLFAAVARALHATTLRRLASLNLFVLFLLVFTPFSMPGEAAWRLGPWTWSIDGLLFAARIGLQANAVMLVCSALLSSMEPADLAHALHRLRLPGKLVHTLFFCVRYLEVLHVEYHRLRNAMTLRAFHPRCTGHALRSLGYLVGMLFIRSCDRSDRILEAMKCRGFDRQMYSLSAFSLGPRDAVFAVLVLFAAGAAACLEWMA